MNLDELIVALEHEPPTNEVRIAAPMRVWPFGLFSYRGYYEDLAIGFAVEGEITERPTVASLLARLREADGKTLVGYKGGEFTMTRRTRVWVSEPSDASGAQVDHVDRDDDVTFLGVRMDRWGRATVSETVAEPKR